MSADVKKPVQTTLDLRSAPAFGAGDFRVAPSNQEAWNWVHRWPAWGAPVLILHGPPGSGKSHLAAIWRAQARMPASAVIENADLMTGERAQAESLLHLYNETQSGGGSLLMTAESPPQAWAFALPDLKSRLLAAPAARLDPPDDALLEMVMVKMFSDRQLAVASDVIAFLLSRGERSFDAVRGLVARLDAKALAEKRPVTIPLARDVLKDIGIL